MKFEKVFLKDSFFLSGITLIKSSYADTVDNKTSVGEARTVISSWEKRIGLKDIISKCYMISRSVLQHTCRNKETSRHLF